VSSKPGAGHLGKAAPQVQMRLVARLKLFSLSARARNLIVQQRLVYLGELVQLKRTELFGKNLGKKTVEDLVNLAKSQGFELGTNIPDWSREAATKLEVQFANEIQIERSSELLATLGPEPRCLEDELARIAAALESGRNLGLLKKLWGWNGSDPRTLDSVAQEPKPRLTRERVRQIEARALRKLEKFKFDTPYLRAAISFLRKESPSIASLLKSGMQEEGISRGQFSVASIKLAAEMFDLKWPLADLSFGGERLLVSQDDEPRFVKIMQIIRRRTSELGCMNILSLAAELQIEEAKSDIICRVVDLLTDVQWLDDEKNWLYLRSAARNRLFNLCSKVLGVCPEIRIAELRRAVARSRRLAMAPPQKILGAFVQDIGLARMDGATVHANPSMVTVPDPDSIEGKMLRVLEEFGPILDGEEFAEKCVAGGINATSFYLYRLLSPIVAALGNGIYCKVGSEVPPGTIENILSRRRATPRSSDHGWMPNGNLWFGFELSRPVITTGAIRLPTFVADLVQGEWQARLPDGSDHDHVTGRDAFMWSFRKAFAVLGVDPDDFVTLEFDKKSRHVLVRAGGPGLFEVMQEPECLDIEEADQEA
jgi:hypothetical protein